MIPSIVKPIQTVEKALTKLAGLDLTRDDTSTWLDHKSGEKTEIGAMSRAASQLRIIMSEIISTLKNRNKSHARLRLDAYGSLAIGKHLRTGCPERDSHRRQLSGVHRRGSRGKQSRYSGGFRCRHYDRYIRNRGCRGVIKQLYP